MRARKQFRVRRRGRTRPRTTRVREGHRAREGRTSGRTQISLQALDDAIASDETCENAERAHNPLLETNGGWSRILRFRTSTSVHKQSENFYALIICAWVLRMRSVRVSSRSFFATKNRDFPRSVSQGETVRFSGCLLYTSPSPRDATLSRMPSSA